MSIDDFVINIREWPEAGLWIAETLPDKNTVTINPKDYVKVEGTYEGQPLYWHWRGYDDAA